MKVSKLRLQNYKSYRDSGEIEFGPHFTVIVGKNNSGKSALLQGLRFRAAGNRPHRSPLFDRETALNTTSKFDAEVVFEWPDLERVAGQFSINRIAFPVHPNEIDRTPNLVEDWRDFVSQK